MLGKLINFLSVPVLRIFTILSNFLVHLINVTARKFQNVWFGAQSEKLQLQNVSLTDWILFHKYLRKPVMAYKSQGVTNTN